MIRVGPLISRGPWGGSSARMVSDCADVGELLEFADRLGLRRAWLQGPAPGPVWFYLSPRKRLLALRYGAQEIEGPGLERLCRSSTLKI